MEIFLSKDRLITTCLRIKEEAKRGKRNSFDCFNLKRNVSLWMRCDTWDKHKSTHFEGFAKLLVHVILYTRCAWPSSFFSRMFVHQLGGVRILIVCLKLWILIWIWNGRFTSFQFWDLCVEKFIWISI